MAAGFPHSVWTRMGTTPVVGFSGASAFPTSVFPSPTTSSTLKLGIAEKFLFGQVVPEFAKVILFGHAILDMRCVPQGPSANASIALAAHDRHLFRRERSQQVGR